MLLLRVCIMFMMCVNVCVFYVAYVVGGMQDEACRPLSRSQASSLYDTIIYLMTIWPYSENKQNPKSIKVQNHTQEAGVYASSYSNISTTIALPTMLWTHVPLSLSIYVYIYIYIHNNNNTNTNNDNHSIIIKPRGITLIIMNNNNDNNNTNNTS